MNVPNTPFTRAAALALALGLAPPGHGASMQCGEEPADASRIAVAGGSLVEILYDLDEQSRIVAVDRTATYPAAARDLPQLGYVRDISAEGLLSLQPTFVLGEHDTGPPEVLAQLERLGIDFLLVPEEFSVEGIREKIRCVAAAVGRAADGEALAAGLLGDLAPDVATQLEVAETASSAPAGIVLLGLREGAPVAAGRDTSGQGLLDMAGARNLMTFEGWKPVSVEAMAAAKPAFIVIPERGVRMAGGMDELLAHPALRLTPAAQERRVISMDGMAMLGFGPRTAQAAARLRAELLEDGLMLADDAVGAQSATRESGDGE
ncbi:MAG: ABC transporter substrate-binding protein [Halieaceae bacterium]|jgi:iron complex transport system substrate-binding protein|nr:ABC transporter substrate-binding protein [Halieaceae bacterium]